MTEASAQNQAPAAPADLSGDADLASVFGLDLGHLTGGDEAPAEVPAIAPAAEPGAAVVAPPAAPVTPPVEPAAPAAAVPPASDPNASPLAAPAKPPTQPAATADPEAALRARSLEAQLEAAQLEVARLKAAPAADTTPAAGTASQVAEPSYALTIPPEVLSAVFGEDATQAGNGLTHLVNSLAKVIHKSVMSEVGTKLQGLRTETAASSAEQERQQQVQQMEEQYYSRFPAHKNPTLLPIVSQEAARLGMQYPSAPVDDNWFAALGSRVNAAVQAITGQAPGSVLPESPAPATPPRKPAAMLPSASARSAPLIPGVEGDDALNSPEAIVNMFTSG